MIIIHSETQTTLTHRLIHPCVHAHKHELLRLAFGYMNNGIIHVYMLTNTYSHKNTHTNTHTNTLCRNKYIDTYTILFVFVGYDWSNNLFHTHEPFKKYFATQTVFVRKAPGSAPWVVVIFVAPQTA